MPFSMRESSRLPLCDVFCIVVHVMRCRSPVTYNLLACMVACCMPFEVCRRTTMRRKGIELFLTSLFLVFCVIMSILTFFTINSPPKSSNPTGLDGFIVLKYKILQDPLRGLFDLILASISAQYVLYHGTTYTAEAKVSSTRFLCTIHVCLLVGEYLCDFLCVNPSRQPLCDVFCIFVRVLNCRSPPTERLLARMMACCMPFEVFRRTT